VAWNLRGSLHYSLDAQLYTAASAVRWLTTLGVLDSASELDARAASDAGGVVCVPALSGLGAPWWKPEATATVTGMTLSTGPGELIRAVVDGIAAQVAELCAALEHDLGGPVAVLRVDGGLTRSRTLMQAVADLAQIPVECYASPHATPLGSAACARMAADSHLTLADAVIPWNVGARYEPRWTADQAENWLHRWREVREFSG